MKTKALRHLRSAVLSFSTLGWALALSPALAAGRINSWDEAARQAQARVPNSQVHSIERETHMGREVFEVEVKTPDGCEHKIVLSAEDGSVVREKRDCD